MLKHSVIPKNIPWSITGTKPSILSVFLKYAMISPGVGFNVTIKSMIASKNVPVSSIMATKLSMVSVLIGREGVGDAGVDDAVLSDLDPKVIE